MVQKIAGVNVSNRANFYFIRPSEAVGAPLPHFESTHLKNHVVHIYPNCDDISKTLKYIINTKTKVTFKVENDSIIKFIPGKGNFLLKKTPPELLQQALLFASNAPDALRDIVKVEKFKWVKLP